MGAATAWWRRVITRSSAPTVGPATDSSEPEASDQPEAAETPPPRSVSPDVVIHASDTDAHVLEAVSAETLDRDRGLVAQIRERITVVEDPPATGDAE